MAADRSGSTAPPISSRASRAVLAAAVADRPCGRRWLVKPPRPSVAAAKRQQQAGQQRRRLGSVKGGERSRTVFSSGGGGHALFRTLSSSSCLDQQAGGSSTAFSPSGRIHRTFANYLHRCYTPRCYTPSSAGNHTVACLSGRVNGGRAPASASLSYSSGRADSGGEVGGRETPKSWRCPTRTERGCVRRQQRLFRDRCLLRCEQRETLENFASTAAARRRNGKK